MEIGNIAANRRLKLTADIAQETHKDLKAISRRNEEAAHVSKEK